MTSISVVVPSAASPLRRSLGGLLVRRLRDRGAEVAVFRDRVPTAGEVGIVLDPHDGLERLASGPEIARFLRRAVVLSTAAGPDGRPRDRPFLEVAAAAAVTSPLLASRLASEERRVELVGIGYDEAYLGKEARERTNDVAVLLPSAAGRDHAIAQLAPVLADRPHELRLDYSRELLGRSATELGVSARRDLLARTRVVVFAPDELNRPCLDWLHLHDVFANGCCVLTSRTMDLGPLVPSEHLVTAGPSSIAWVLESLLSERELERRVGEAGRALVEAELPLGSCAEALLDLAASLPPVSGRRFVPSTRTRPDAVSDGEAAETVARLALENARLRLAAPVVKRAGTVRSTAYLSINPEISVVVPLHNYREFVEDAIESALAATGVRLEVVVVDDASTDDSAARVAELIGKSRDSALLLHRRPLQGGPGASRNTGFRLARAELILTLDADDLLYPHGPARLVHALRSASDAGFAYGVVDRFNAEGPIDLVATQGFDVGLFAHGNFLPSMALIRKDAWEAVGGFSEQGIYQLGWEDYEFWLRLIDAGYGAAWTPTLVARYRKHGDSLLRLTDLVVPKLDAQIRADHPAVFERALA